MRPITVAGRRRRILINRGRPIVEAAAVPNGADADAHRKAAVFHGKTP